jgi:hypothetical protein
MQFYYRAHQFIILLINSNNNILCDRIKVTIKLKNNNMFLLSVKKDVQDLPKNK